MCGVHEGHISSAHVCSRGPVLGGWWVQKAADAYGSCLGWISDNNLSIRRDVLEGMARCFTKLGRRNRALDIVNILVIQ